MSRRARCDPQYEADEVKPESRNHLEELVLDIFVLGQETLVGSNLFLAKQDRVRNGCEDERV